MNEEAFVESMNVHLRELESIAEDVEEIANEFPSYVMHNRRRSTRRRESTT